MSAFGGIADIRACLLYPQKRTLELSRGMSALCQKQTFCSAAKERLFDHLVGARVECGRQGDPVGICGSQIDDDLEGRRASFKFRLGGRHL